MQGRSIDIPASQSIQITSLRLERQGLERLPTNLAKRFPNLQQLYLNHNILRQLPQRLFELPRLRVLQLDHNKLTRIPESVVSCNSLRQLSLRGNRLKNLPSLGTQLETLDLAQNHLSQWPTAVDTCQQLLHLDLSDNRLSELPSRLAEHFPALQYLNLSGNGLRKLPPLPLRLYALIIARNKLTTLPSLASYSQLQRLDIRHNRMTLPLAALPSGLQYLDVRHTPTRWPSPEKLIDHSPLLTHAYGGFNKHQQLLLEDFLKLLAQRPECLSTGAYWQLWRGQLVSTLSTAQLLSCLHPSQEPAIAAQAHRLLCCTRSLTATSLRTKYWAILGDTGTPRRTLQLRLQRLGVNHIEDTAQADGLILGHSLTTIPNLKETAHCIEERQLLHLLDKLQGRHLTNSPAEALVPLIRDLNALHAPTRQLALDSLGAFGTPDEVLPTLWSQWKKGHKETLSEVLLPYLPPLFQRILVHGRQPVGKPVLRRKLEKKLFY